jgi:MFS family permease
MSLHNIIEQLDFYCETDMEIGLFGSSFLVGVVIGCVTFARMGDIYGRKKIFIIGMML